MSKSFCDSKFQQIIDYSEDFGVQSIGKTIDAGIKVAGGWKVAKSVLEILSKGSSIVSYDQVEVKGVLTPSVSLYWDDFELCDTYAYKCQSSLGTDSNTIYAAPESLVNYTIVAGMLIPILVQKLKGVAGVDLQFGYSNCPIIKVEMKENVDEDFRKMYESGFAGIYLRGDDEVLQTFANEWQERFEIRLHNMTSGNTFIKKARWSEKND